MRLRLQLAGWIMAAGLGAMIAAPCPAQRMHRASWGQQNSAPRAQARREALQQQRQQERRAARPPQQEKRQNGAADKPRRNPVNGPNYGARSNGNPNRPPSAYSPPPVQRKFSDLSPQEKQRVLQNYQRLNKMPPQQREELRDRVATWNRLTPQQRSHIRNDILPEWRQMPQDRRQALRQKLRVLQNMPEFARNQRLNDPNFTRGMSDEDRATLRDLSHMHVGAPDPPNE